MHGWRETKRIWWRNVKPLARAGFEVVAYGFRDLVTAGRG